LANDADIESNIAGRKQAWLFHWKMSACGVIKMNLISLSILKNLQCAIFSDREFNTVSIFYTTASVACWCMVLCTVNRIAAADSFAGFW